MFHFYGLLSSYTSGFRCLLCEKNVRAGPPVAEGGAQGPPYAFGARGPSGPPVAEGGDPGAQDGDGREFREVLPGASVRSRRLVGSSGGEESTT